jgi:hypothetical protein
MTGFGGEGEAWGDGELEGSESLPGEMDLGGGHRLQINAAVFRQFLNSPPVQAAVAARGAELAEAAKSA